MDPEKSHNIYANRYQETRRLCQGFWSLLLVWKGSVLKLIWAHLALYVSAYILLTVLYHTVFIHHPPWKDAFDIICIYASRFSKHIPVTFMTGFYVANVVSRYWDQFISLPHPDKLAQRLVALIPGQDEYHRTLRRTVMRQVNLSMVMVYRRVATKVLCRFPTYESLIDAGLMLPNEARQLAEMEKISDHETSWVPMLWANYLIAKERKSERLKLEATLHGSLLTSFDHIQATMRKIFDHGWVNFPLAYTQLITITVYSYLLASLFANQHLIPDTHYSNETKTVFTSGIILVERGAYVNHTPVVYFPFYAIVEFIAYLGWIKVAETLLNPWGDDDEDFQINYLIDKNFQISMLIVDDGIPNFDLTPDRFMRESVTVPSELTYANAPDLRPQVSQREKKYWNSNPYTERRRSNAVQLQYLNRHIDRR